MLFAVICKDKAGAFDVRIATRDAHLEYITATKVVVHAGPFLNEAEQMIGSLVVINVTNMTAAQAWADSDPYAKAGLFHSVQIERWNKVIG